MPFTNLQTQISNEKKTTRKSLKRGNWKILKCSILKSISRHINIHPKSFLIWNKLTNLAENSKFFYVQRNITISAVVNIMLHSVVARFFCFQLTIISHIKCFRQFFFHFSFLLWFFFISNMAKLLYSRLSSWLDDLNCCNNEMIKRLIQILYYIYTHSVAWVHAHICNMNECKQKHIIINDWWPRDQGIVQNANKTVGWLSNYVELLYLCFREVKN